MTKTTIWPLVLTMALASVAPAATDEERCQKRKLIALGKRDLCLRKERGQEVVGKTSDVTRCAEKFAIQVEKAEKKATCRWLDNGDGTATDLNSGLQWELKTDDGSIHDKDDTYKWSATGVAPDGTAFVDFLGTLNGGVSADGVTTTTCFAGNCDWRFPTIAELADIVDLTAPGCGGGFPCTTIPGETVSAFYWASSTFAADANGAWGVYFFDGTAFSGGKNGDGRARAVRGGS